MSIGFRNVQAESEGAVLRVRVEAENRSRMIWRASEGFMLGAQLIDPETQSYVEDGPRVELDHDVAPGESGRACIQVELPPQTARHRVYIAPLLGGRWLYENGWPFIALDLSVEGGRAELAGVRVLTMRGLRAGILLRSLGRAFAYPVAGLWRNRRLVRSAVWRDIVGRYRGSFVGLFWTVLNPVLLILTYFFVFGVVLRARFDGDPSRSGFILYFLAGMLPWLAFSEAAGRAPAVLAEHRNLVKKVRFPVEILPATLAAGGLVTQGFALAGFLALLLGTRGGIPASAAWLPVLLAPQLLFTLGVCWFLAALGAYVRDLGQVNGFLLTLWFFLTPICYPETALSARMRGILSMNPLSVLVRGYREILLEPAGGLTFGPLWKLWLVSAAVFFLGYAWFHKLRRDLADVI